MVRIPVSWGELFDKITKVSAVIWIVSCVFVALYYYR